MAKHSAKLLVSRTEHIVALGLGLVVVAGAIVLAFYA